MNTFSKLLIVITLLFTLSSSLAQAHVTVKPKEVGVAAYQSFSMAVPVEKDQPTTSLKLLIPEGLESVMPNVKPGWTIVVSTTGEGEDAKTTQIEWQGGSIPVGQRDEFSFSAKTPSSPTNLNWKAYQTYKDGTVVSWDMDPEMDMDHSDENTKEGGPYSVTAVIDDLTAPESTLPATPTQSTDKKAYGAVAAALVLSVISLVVSFTKKSA